ncbi:hypothetical protein [Rhodococcus sp. ACS1]|uniref:hypothetical protein n=1 Tax=Rhodococcus sp. ACS1 TaxID=2028570 RepID=UPI0015C82053|nr:hypothetical protein [Rhodococcus sp. ACS1]
MAHRFSVVRTQADSFVHRADSDHHIAVIHWRYRRVTMLRRVSPSLTSELKQTAGPSGAAGPCRIDAESIALVEFALRWLPFGGPSADDVLVEFGISMLTFAQRIEEILASGRWTGLDLAERNRLREMAAAVGRRSERR